MFRIYMECILLATELRDKYYICKDVSAFTALCYPLDDPLLSVRRSNPGECK